MGTVNKFLNIAPSSCRYCSGAFYAIQRIAEEAKAQGLFVTECNKGDANKQPVWDAITADDPILVNGFGHGSTTTYTGNSETEIFHRDRCSILAGRVVYLLSCYTGVELGPSIINNGGLAYGGYKIAWTWMTGDVRKDPYEDYWAEGFYKSSNEFPIALIQGDPVFKAEDRCIAKYNEWIAIWEERGESAPVKWLIHDRDGLVVLGDKGVVITSDLPRIEMLVETEPPKEVKANEVIYISGKLVDRVTKDPLPNETVHLSKDHNRIDSLLTDASGGFIFGTTFTSGKHILRVEYDGSKYYSPTCTILYKIDVGLSKIEITQEPPNRVDPLEPFTVAGILTSGGEPVNNKPVNFVVIRGETITTTTNTNGEFVFTTSIPDIGHARVYAEFLGDEEYTSAKSKEYSIAVGVLPYFGFDKEPSGSWTDAGNGRRIKGWVFECPEDGYAKDITVFLYNQHKPTNAKCAIYDYETKELLAITEERIFDYLTKQWESFLLTTNPLLKGGHKYLLAIMDTGDMYVTWFGTAGIKQEEWDETPYGDFPATWKPWISYTYVSSIYCSYEPVEGEPPTEYILSIDSTPISASVKLNGIDIGNTPITTTVTEGTHEVSVPLEITTDRLYKFINWEDGSVNNIRTINVISNMSITAYYQEVEEVTHTCAGAVSDQEIDGELVTVEIEKPDGSIDILETTTLPDKSYTIDYTATETGTYTAQSFIDEDTLYQGAESDIVEFTVGKAPRTITLAVTPK